MIDIGRWLNHAINSLKGASETPSLEAQVLLSYHLQKSRAWIIAHPEFPLSGDDGNTLNSLLKQIVSGIPLPYLTGVQEFYGLDFRVTKDVLIPRPETELMVEIALDWLADHPHRHRILDIGTGSGCISISIAAHANNIKGIATDISYDALKIARSNAVKHHIGNHIDFINCRLSLPLKCRFDIICANLPYIPTGTLRHLSVARHEPWIALDGGDDGLYHIRTLLSYIRSQLSVDGIALLEIEETQEASVLMEAGHYFYNRSIEVIDDLAGKPRFLHIQNDEN